MTRVTAIRSDQPFGDESEATDWVRQVSSDPDLARAETNAAIGLINRALQAAAIAEADPYIGPRRAAQAVAIRVGHGGGEELADGRFSQAVAIDLEAGKRRRRRTDGVGSQERMAAIFGGREQADLCEGLILRARLELDADREAETALCLSQALPILLQELDGALSDPGHSEDMAELRRRRPQVSRVAEGYLGGAAGVGTGSEVGTAGAAGAEAQEILAEALALAERVLRRRRILRG